MAPTKFLLGDLVLVDFPHVGHWPAEITEIFKNSKREVNCFGKGERGYAIPRDMIYFNYESMKVHLSDSSWKKDPTRKKALEQVTDKYKKQFLQNSNDEEDYGKLQRSSSVYEKEITYLDSRVGDELSAPAGTNQEIEEYKINMENMRAKVTNLEAHNESLEQSIKHHTNDLENLTIKHKDEISKKVDENKLLNEQIRQLQKEKEKLVEEKLALEKEYATHRMSVEESRAGLSPSPDSSRQAPREVIRKSSMEVNESFKVKTMYKRKRLEVGLEVDESYSQEDKSRRKNLEKDDGSMGPDADQSYSKEDMRKRLEEHKSSLEDEESFCYMMQQKLSHHLKEGH